jgi:cytochrome c553
MKRIWLWGLVVPWVLRRAVPRWIVESPLVVAARHPWLTLAAAAAAVAIGGLLVSATGVVPIKASAGHWPITEWFLQFSKTRSIAFHARGIDVPPLEDRDLVLRGAGHYELGCRPCHGGARGDVPRIAEYMLPPPPDLTMRAPTRTSAELFYVVKHGIKLTGMPAWAAQPRDDEVWAVVAFLRRLPALDQAEYRRLTRGGEHEEPLALPAVTPVSGVVADTCARCHGVDGEGRGGVAPRLAGQRREYLDRALRAYADGRRYSGIMGPVARALTPEARAVAAAYYAALPPPQMSMDAQVFPGELLATHGDATRMIPACVECHGTAGVPKNPAYPRLAGQHASYLALQLTLLQARARGGSEYVHLMHSFVDRLTAEQIREVSAYFASAPSVQ